MQYPKIKRVFRRAVLSPCLTTPYKVYIVYTILHGWFWTLYYVCKNWRRLKMFVCSQQVVPKRQHDRKLKLRPVLSYIQSNLNKILIRFICVSSSCHDHLTRIIFNQEKIHHFFCTYMNETPGYREFLYCFFDLLLCKFSGVWKGLKTTIHRNLPGILYLQ